jgi:predicted PurR-regulated permease PerM
VSSHRNVGPAEGAIASRPEFIRRTLIVIALVLLGAMVATMVVLAADVLLVIFGGVLLAVFFDGLGDLLHQHGRVPQRVATGIVIGVSLALMIASAWLLAAEVLQQLGELGTSLTQVWNQIQERIAREPWGRQLLALVTRAQASGEQTANIGTSVVAALTTTLGGIANALIILFLGIYLASSPGWYRRGLLSLIPPTARRETRSLLQRMGHSLRWWLFGRAVGMLIVGIITAVGLWLLDVPLALGLGSIAAVADFVPFVGPIVAAAPGVLVASTGGAAKIGSVVALYAAIQVFEGYILTPLIERRSVQLPPALTIAAQVMLGVLIGGAGVVFATPLLVVIVLMVQHLYVEDVIDKQSG